MPTAPTYPGVYIEEIPSGVRTITGVATSITAFVGRAQRGPVDEPVTINSFGDFERIFGGRWRKSTMGFAVRDFYQNGGSQAVIVRLFNPTFDTEALRTAAAEAARVQAQTAADAVAKAAEDAVIEGATLQTVESAAKTAVAAASATGKWAASAAEEVASAATDAVSTEGATPQSVAAAASNAVADAVAHAVSAAAPVTHAKLTVGGLSLVAQYPGEWGNVLRARVDYDVDPGTPGLFNLSVRDGATGDIEMFRNLSVDVDHPRNVTNVLSDGSRLVKVDGAAPGSRPAKSGAVVPSQGPFGETSSTGVTTLASDGDYLDSNDFTKAESKKQGIYALEKTNLFNLLCIPPYKKDGDVDSGLWAAAATYCEKRRAMLLVDSPSTWTDKDRAKAEITEIGTKSKNAALFFPRLRQPNPTKDNQFDEFVPCGAVAGVFARTDAERGVWKAPAGLAATLRGVPQLSVSLTDMETGELNPLGINCLMVKPPAGRVVWGARTLQGDDRFASEWKYTPVRRTALFIEETLFRATQWAVFEPNDEPLWAQLRLNIGAFMQNLFRQGAFQGSSPRDAYFVKCDKETTTQNDINLGIVNIAVGFAPLKPAEFVIIKIQQMAGQIET